MHKYTLNKKSKKLTRNAHFYANGELLKKMNSNSSAAAKEAFSVSNLGGSIGSIGGAIGTITEAAMSNAEVDTSKADNAIEAVNNYQPATHSLDALADSYNNINFAESDWEGKDFSVSTGKALANMGKAGLSGAAAGAQVGGIWGAIGGLAAGLGAAGAGWAVGSSKAKAEAERLERESLLSNTSALAKAEDARNDIQLNDYNNFRRNVAAKGGRIHTMKDNIFNNGGLMHQHGGIFSNGIISVNNGGTHEQNPLEGVQMGIDREGIPNLVEEGEVIWNDYVFSNRLNVPGKSHSFAEEAKKLQRESEERPNDPISKNGLDSSMAKLMIEQEGVRQKEESNNNVFDKGGMKKTKNKSSNNSISTLANQVLEHDYYVNQLGFPTVEKGKRVIKGENFKNKIKEITGGNNPVTMEDIISLFSRDKKETKKNRYDFGSYLRYAPVVGSALSVLSDATGLTNTPDYSDAELVKEAAGNIRDVGYTPVTEKLTYNPFDTQFYSAKLAEQNAATKRAIQNAAQTSGATIAGLLLSDYNTQGKMGDLFRQAEEYNQAQRERVATFNRGTSAMNAEMAMKAELANQQGDETRLRAAMAEAELRGKERASASAARSANLTNLFDNLGSVGKEKFMMDIIEKNPALLYTFMGEYKVGNTEACGGKINRRRRK